MGETADYIIQQPSCTAVKVEFPAAGPPEGGAPHPAGLASDPAGIRLRAYALMCGVLKFLGLDESQTLERQ